ncbi:MAG: alpha/beta hydrolase [Chloroflexi bacterium]|nr:alpha/beta hydrolase [Chloroflexota bacterium]
MLLRRPREGTDVTANSSGETLDGLAIEHRYAHLGDVRLHYVEAGTGPLVLLLHGFPDFWYSWRKQIPNLVQAGFRVVAPDLRGYNLSGKPRDVHRYRAEFLARDVARLIRACGVNRAAVVGHDWGGMAGWQAAMSYPRMVDRLVILNVPHPERFLRGLQTWRQLRKSWYMFFFQLPRVPEAVLRANDFAAIRESLRTDVTRPEAFTEADLDRYVDALARPGALTSALNYYRALFLQSPRQALARLRRIEQPVLVVWGEQDRYVGAELAEPGREWVPSARIVRIEEASHWVHLEFPERVNELIIDFLKGARDSVR